MSNQMPKFIVRTAPKHWEQGGEFRLPVILFGKENFFPVVILSPQLRIPVEGIQTCVNGEQ